MSLDRGQQLTREGYERVAERGVALQHTIWKIDLTIEHDRELRLAEETVMRLIDAGVRSPEQIAKLMGLDADAIVPDAIVNLLRKGRLSHIAQLEVTPLGRLDLQQHMTREQRRYEDVELRHDPYTDTLVWRLSDSELKSPEAVRNASLHPLPVPAELEKLDVEVRHREVQEQLERFGLPFEKSDGSKRGTRDIIQLTANHPYPAWREARLEVWYHRERDDWQWRILHDGGDDVAISKALKALEAEGATILPLEKPDRTPVSEKGAVVKTLAERVTSTVREAETEESTTTILRTEDHRGALRKAVEVAREELLIISPWLRIEAIDGELLGWLDRALQTQNRLRIVVGYGIEKDSGQDDAKSRNQREALKKLNRLGNRHHGRLRTVEIGNTHEKIVVCDDRYAIVTSFNWLSFNPRPGQAIRRELGTLLKDPAEVARLRSELKSLLGK